MKRRGKNRSVLCYANLGQEPWGGGGDLGIIVAQEKGGGGSVLMGQGHREIVSFKPLVSCWFYIYQILC